MIRNVPPAKRGKRTVIAVAMTAVYQNDLNVHRWFPLLALVIAAIIRSICDSEKLVSAVDEAAVDEIVALAVSDGKALVANFGWRSIFPIEGVG